MDLSCLKIVSKATLIKMDYWSYHPFKPHIRIVYITKA